MGLEEVGVDVMAEVTQPFVKLVGGQGACREQAGHGLVGITQDTPGQHQGRQGLGTPGGMAGPSATLAAPASCGTPMRR
ncbi:hypothetical protein ACH47Z_42530 [Streptomyces sp. NPDC020192]|uniref:hypothetical protein n=1 Tax=Streptomyces sp. NPDC020192 TaxID=3365066 RepID=UPI0037A0560C